MGFLNCIMDVQHVVLPGPPLTNLVAWHDFGVTTNLYTDTGLTTHVVNDGDLIKGSADKSGVNNHLTEATNPPTYKTNIRNGYGVARFDGTNDILRAVAVATRAASTVLVAAVKRSAISASVRAVYGLDTGQNSSLIAYSGDSANYYVWVRKQDTSDAELTGADPTVWSVPTVKTTDASNMTIYYNGAATIATFDPHDAITSGTVIQLGANGAATWFGDYDIGEFLIYNTALSDANRQTAERYLGTRWGVTVA